MKLPQKKLIFEKIQIKSNESNGQSDDNIIKSNELNSQSDKNIIKSNKLNNQCDENIHISPIIINEIDVKSLAPSKIDHYRLENNLLLEKYGSEIYTKIKIQEKKQINYNILSKHTLSSELRTKLVDWVKEVYFKLDVSATTYFKTIHILDTYLINTKKTTTDKICLLVIVCILIATKFEGEEIGINFLYEKIGHKSFSKKEIFVKEIEVLNEIGIENIMSTSALECITILLYDFEQNNDNFLSRYKLYTFIDHLKLNAIYFAELVLHFDEFNTYECIYKGLGCIFFAFKQLKVQNYELNYHENFYIEQWIIFKFKRNPYNQSYEQIYKQICEIVKKYNSLDYIEFNINISYLNDLEKLKKSSKHIDCKACKIH